MSLLLMKQLQYDASTQSGFADLWCEIAWTKSSSAMNSSLRLLVSMGLPRDNCARSHLFPQNFGRGGYGGGGVPWTTRQLGFIRDHTKRLNNKGELSYGS